ncbi:DNA-deoxyinosine glycosylase [Paenibacillus xerothermodurans]|uniref:DNA-deoxyinosine glycosylase n=1 Tax=Paenibacillus xerothermodurans TaxID=1977292 RepID=UPI001FB42307|nr:DNA-deoxyinosine glycosylase [Paenibacillus xerothermodurans]
MPDRVTRLQGLPPVVDRSCTVLVLGSMPGVQSLYKQEYYGNPRNHFWRLLYTLYGADAEPSDIYEERLEFALRHHVALWDVLASCERKGSLDADIRQPEANDFPAFFQAYPALQRVFFNGQAAERMYRKHVIPVLRAQGVGAKLRCATLPSTSPARTISFEAKLAMWRVLRS